LLATPELLARITSDLPGFARASSSRGMNFERRLLPPFFGGGGSAHSIEGGGEGGCFFVGAVRRVFGANGFS
jgi:hypothetical protein